eukprot:TRINITY_DN14846_c0_g1_i5.p1 TRINITY_DN14846_c0_g1~~TRINITY_DN14846_c0_g1_i5.p1  ORF type:complete len:118 (-),score=36.89 TRINITY_DN14846_c0_g1_i5:142-495(-)
MGTKGQLFQLVFSLIGLIWGILLFFAEFTFRCFRKNFGFLRSRFGRFITYLMIGLLCIFYGLQSSEVVVVLAIGVIAVVVGTMHICLLFPCLADEPQADNPASLSYEQHVRMMERMA